MSSICAAPVTQIAQARLGRRHEESSAAREHPERVLPERINQARCLACSESFHEESHGIGRATIMCRTPATSVKATRRTPAFPHDGQHIGLSATLRGSSSTAHPLDLQIARASMKPILSTPAAKIVFFYFCFILTDI